MSKPPDLMQGTLDLLLLKIDRQCTAQACESRSTGDPAARWTASMKALQASRC